MPAYGEFGTKGTGYCGMAMYFLTNPLIYLMGKYLQEWKRVREIQGRGRVQIQKLAAEPGRSQNRETKGCGLAMCIEWLVVCPMRQDMV